MAVAKAEKILEKASRVKAARRRPLFRTQVRAKGEMRGSKRRSTANIRTLACALRYIFHYDSLRHSSPLVANASFFARRSAPRPRRIASSPSCPPPSR